MEKLDTETERKIQELQILEQSLQNLLMQKQAFQLELNETDNALKEIKKTKEDVFKVIGQVMIKADKAEIEKELAQRAEIIRIRLTSIERQEQELSKKAEKLKKEVLEKIK